jgi:hypothetical protein
MRKVRNITVSVDPELYRQTRRLAAEYDTNVTDIVRFLLERLPGALKAARYPGGHPQSGIAAARAASATPPAPTSAPLADPLNSSQPAPVPDPASNAPSPVQIQENPRKPPVPL